MSADNITNLFQSNLVSAPTKALSIEASQADVQRFDNAYTAKIAQLDTQVTPAVQAPTAVQQPVETNPVNSADAQERARRALGLEAAEDPSAGDRILDGLQGLRQVMENQQSAIMQHVGKKEMDIATMTIMQYEVAKYSLLVDVTSKLAGKSTQSFDSLLKNQ